MERRRSRKRKWEFGVLSKKGMRTTRTRYLVATSNSAFGKVS
jgi:hypothetical protein